MFFSATRFVEAFAFPWNLSMQIGVSCRNYSASDRFTVIASAWPPVTQRPK
jgi:hypothetical protein